MSEAMNPLQQLFQMGQQMQARLSEIQTQLAQTTVTGSSGGGMVTAVVDGRLRLRQIHLEPSLMNAADIEMLEDLVLAAVADAQSKALKMYEEELRRVTGGLLPLNLSGLFGGV
ncbi:MAG: YbaB/EbfC family nucleoid-associated protein [Gemmatimonadetes bacterium]|nr:YbaB/EbfC family nucleoid-associated protein [Gemmatimonadota bacterium]